MKKLIRYFTLRKRIKTKMSQIEVYIEELRASKTNDKINIRYIYDHEINEQSKLLEMFKELL